MAQPSNQMSPNASPGSPKASGVRRVNNMPLIVLGVGIAVFLAVMIMVAKERADKQHQMAPSEEKKGGGSSLVMAKAIVGKETSGIVPAATPPKIPDLFASAAVANPVKIATADDLQPPTPPGRGREMPFGRERDPLVGGGAGASDANDQIARSKMEMLSEAIKAKPNVQVSEFRSPATASGSGVGSGAPQTRDEMLARIEQVKDQIANAASSDPTAAYKARLAQLQSAGTIGGGVDTSGTATGGSLAQSGDSNGSGKDVQQFNGKADRWTLGNSMDVPKPYQIRTGAVLPATLISGINSDLPGQIQAQVSQNVYDTATGKFCLIPQGSRLIGAYSSNVAYGQSRVLVAWQRIIFPDGKALDIGSMNGADEAGYGGLSDQVNNHYLRLFTGAVLLSAVTAGVTLSTNSNESAYGTTNASTALSEALGTQLGQTATQLIQKNLNISPTIEIRPGFRFNVMVTKDLTFSKAYQAFDY